MADDQSSYSGMDPFEGSAFSGFALPAVGSALAVCPPGEAPLDREVLLWTLVRMGGGEHPKKVPHDCVGRLYHQETGVFSLPTWPPSLPIPQKLIDEDKSMKDIQHQWGMAALAL